MIKYLSVSADGDMLFWDHIEDAEESILGDGYGYGGLSAGEKASIYEVKVETANLDDVNVFVVYEDCGVEFVKSPTEDDDVVEVYKVKHCYRSWEFKVELTTRINHKPELPF